MIVIQCNNGALMMNDDTVYSTVLPLMIRPSYHVVLQYYVLPTYSSTVSE